MSTPQIHLFPNGQVEVGNGKPGYDWHPAYSQLVTPTSESQPLTLTHWQQIAKRDGMKTVLHKTRAAAVAALSLNP